ncbi:MAG: sugar phosphate isomerase/epimerase [Candidatus Aenigmarchaeota archaeon]|nr:sugar phosphate isomerase/epimerase [Candidatus Aenigmarchaeota archaeon]
MANTAFDGEIEIGLLTVPFGTGAKLPEIAQWSANHGYKRLSIAAWPPPELGGSQRKGEDAFVAAHLGSLDDFNESRASEVKGALSSAGIKPHSLAYFENMSTANADERRILHDNFGKICRIGKMIGADYIGTFPGRNIDMDEEAALKFFIEKIGPGLQKTAVDNGVKVYFENCIMEGLMGRKGKVVGNVAYCPANWRRIFSALDEWYMNPDPSHMVWQGIDYVKAIKEFQDRVVEVHAKDGYVLEKWRRPEATKDLEPLPFKAENYETGLVRDDHPVFDWGAGLYYHAAPGLGSVDWGKVTQAMRETGIAERGVPLVVELEDEAFGPRATGMDNYGKAGFSVSIRTLQPYCSAGTHL